MRKILRWLIDHSRWVLNNKGVIDPETAMILSGLISGGLGLAGSFLGGGDDDDDLLRTFMPQVQFLQQPAPDFYRAPSPEFFRAPSPEQYAEFPEAEKARQTWFGKLMQWGQEPDYGAISPAWQDIWQEAQNRVSQYYWGGPGGQPGLASKVKASAARRGVSQSPALERELSLMGMQEAGDIRGLAQQQAIQKAQFGEAGRQNWLQNLMQLTSLRPQYYQPAGTWQSAIMQQPYAVTEQSYMAPQTTTPTTGEYLGELGSAAGQLGMQYSQFKWLEDMLKQNKSKDPYSYLYS